VKITGSVPLDQVPEGRPDLGTLKGVWAVLADRLVADHKKGLATRVEVADQKELTRLRNSTLRYIRDQHKMRLLAAIVPTDKGVLDVYLTLQPLEPEPEPEPEPVRPTYLGRPRGRSRKAQ